MNEKDAATRGITSGEKATVRSAARSITLPVEVSDEMMPGVISIPHGWGHGRDGVELSVAAAHAGESINDVTDDQAVDRVCGTAAFNGNIVLIERADTVETRRVGT
jgi:anaerobic selenocysteine-containing dehydrogenase